MLHSKMQNRIEAMGDKLARPGVVLAVALSLLVGFGGRHVAIAGGEHEGTLSDTWKTTVTIINCQTGSQLPIPQNPFPTLYTFEKNVALLEALSRNFLSSGHGDLGADRPE